MKMVFDRLVRHVDKLQNITNLIAFRNYNPIKAFKKQGVTCSQDWLLYGIGDSPALPNSQKPITAVVSISPDIDREITQKELLLFHRSNVNATDFIIPDNSMSPVFRKGDHVAGRRRFGDEISNIINSDCIIQIEQGETVVRQLKTGDSPNHYNLVALDSKVKIIKNVVLFSAAPIVRVWRKEPKLN